jgi:hypothetical protein
MLASDAELVSMTSDGLAALGLNVLPSLLLPLAGPEEFDLDVRIIPQFVVNFLSYPLLHPLFSQDTDILPPALQFLPSTKTRDPDPIIRLTLVETLLLIGTTRKGRVFMRENGVYLIVRALHLDEADDRVCICLELPDTVKVCDVLTLWIPRFLSISYALSISCNETKGLKQRAKETGKMCRETHPIPRQNWLLHKKSMKTIRL